MNECAAKDCAKNTDGKCKKNKVNKAGQCVAYTHRVGYERRSDPNKEGTHILGVKGGSDPNAEGTKQL